MTTSELSTLCKFCISNAGLIELVTRDRLKLLEANRKSNPAAFMVSVDPSDGQGTCHCENCEKLGTTTDRVFSLSKCCSSRLTRKTCRRLGWALCIQQPSPAAYY